MPGAASIRGIVPLSVSLDHIGPMCRSVADAALMLQLCGRALGEVDVLALAHAYEQATDWHQRTPSL